MLQMTDNKSTSSSKKIPDHFYSDDTDLRHPHEGEPKRFYDPKFKHYAVKIMPGTHYVTSRHDEMLVTTLGSCVSACIRDTALGVGGMNHFMLPESDTGKWGGSSAAMRYGNHAMETLLNDVLAMGGAKNRFTSTTAWSLLRWRTGWEHPCGQPAFTVRLAGLSTTATGF